MSSSMAKEPHESLDEVARAEAQILSVFRCGYDGLLRGRPERRLGPADDEAVFELADRAVHEYVDAMASDPALPRLARAQLFEIRRSLFLAHSALGPLGPLLTGQDVEDVQIGVPPSGLDAARRLTATTAAGAEPFVIAIRRRACPLGRRRDATAGPGGRRRRDQLRRRCPRSGRPSSRQWRT